MAKKEEVTRDNNLHVSQLVEFAYTVAKEQFKGDFFSFHSLWSKTWKGASAFSKEKVENWIGFFYAEILLDPRFVAFNFNKWKLKEFMSFEDIKKLETTVFSEDSMFEEGYADYMADEKRKKKEVEVVPGDDVSVDDIVPDEESEDGEELDEGDMVDAEDPSFDTEI
ncbi:DNA-directed RNA polymerase delta subunit (RNAP delta factor) [Mycoplasma haemofelis str. Langford 1]|uniref:RNAP delta factor n=1 Tax=Mycoplasma haemofelis (strain Langford 1) TaxID=941640 RepID=E8ZKD7_MYCHL|nr:DNA-directed RNA polymerase subunit delta [Mycoplasma haemofelis]CBY92103.1 DNA-directed RNA polymerase delta subunit (RNAP delta factor) [Mycoplasma haemofelis str. Langford 1]